MSSSGELTCLGMTVGGHPLLDARPSGSCRSFRLGTNRNLSSVDMCAVISGHMLKFALMAVAIRPQRLDSELAYALQNAIQQPGDLLALLRRTCLRQR